MNLRRHRKKLTIDVKTVKAMVKGDEDKLYEFIHTNIDRGATTDDLLDFAVDLLMESRYPVKHFKEFCKELGLSNIRINFEIPEKRVGEA